MTRAWRRLLVPGVSTFVMLLVLVGLGTWQVYRLHWKERILARIAAAEVAPPVALTADPAPYTKVTVTGRFLFDHAGRYGALVRDTRGGPELGADQIVPLVREGGVAVLVDRGWIPQKRAAPLDDPGGEVTVVGYVRPGDVAHWFSPTDDTADRQFYTLDTAVIGAALDVPRLAPFTLVALGPSSVGVYPAPAEHLPRPPNNHLSYVVTWYGLATALIVIFVVWVRKGRKDPV